MDDFRIEKLTEAHYDAVAELFNASDEAWPGGLVHGNPMNRERIARRYSDLEVIEVLVGMSGEKAVGILDISPFHAERAAAYVNFLNVHPDWHGKGCGRRLLQRSVDVATSRGFERLDLYTWSGNMKAVPAYKRTGFFWYPGTSVYMQNFLPQILTAPPLGDFFSRNQWYASFQRPVEVREDLEVRNGRRVYTYKFKGDAELEVLIDVLSSRMCSVRLDGQEWSLTAEGEELFVGYDKRVACRHDGSPAPAITCRPGFSTLPVRISEPAGGNDAGSSAFTTETPASAEGDGTQGYAIVVRTSSSAPRHREEERAEAFNASFATAAGPLRLGVGFLSRLPVEATFIPSPGILPAGGSGEMDVALCNRTGHEVVQATEVAVDGLPAARLECTLAPLERRVSAIPVSASPLGRVCATTTIAGGPSYTEPVPFLAPGRLMPDAEAYEDRLFASDGRYVLEAEPNKGARLTLRRADSAYPLFVQLYEEIGPPFRPGQLRARAYSARTDETPGGLRLTFEAESERPRVRVVRTVDLLKDGTIEISRHVRNLSDEEANFQLMHTGWLALSSRRVMPTPHGVVDARPRGDYPGWQDDLPLAPESNPQGWTYAEGNGGALGVAWETKGLAEMRAGLQSLPDLVWSFRLPPGGEGAAGRVILIPGAASPDEARRVASRVNPRQSPLADVQGPVAVSIEPWPLLSAGRATLHARSLRETEVRGQVRWVAGGKELVSMPINLKGFGQSASTEFDYAPNWLGGGERAELFVVTELEEVSRPLPAINIAFKHKDVHVKIEPGTPWRINNGFIEFQVDPSYNAVMHSLRRVGIGHEYLASPYPAVTELSWFRPWRGGIGLFAMPFDSYPGRLDEETWSARPLHGRLGGCDVSGIRLETTLTKSDKSLRGITLTRDFITAAGSPVVVARTTVGGMGGTLIEFSDQMFTSFNSPESVCEFTDAGSKVKTLRHRATRWMAADGPVVISDQRRAMVMDQYGEGKTNGFVMDLGLHGVHYESYGAVPLSKSPFTFQTAMAACLNPREARWWSPAVTLAARAAFVDTQGHGTHN